MGAPTFPFPHSFGPVGRTAHGISLALLLALPTLASADQGWTTSGDLRMGYV
ncbi:MAG: hypothetical protein GX826_01035, partial [Gammaproteobacteria bacterium]|nr:hypothetical protein [Gammaproteobacteria bacterium]